MVRADSIRIVGVVRSLNGRRCGRPTLNCSSIATSSNTTRLDNDSTLIRMECKQDGDRYLKGTIKGGII